MIKEKTQSGFANGISTQLAEKINKEGEAAELSHEEKQNIIKEAATHYGNFLDALGIDWKNDPNSNNTPMRVAKAYVNDLFSGRYQNIGKITAFPNGGYDGIVQESNIPIVSKCSHHHETIKGKVSIAYIPSENGKVVGLSKLNRIVEHFGRRGQIQEGLTVQIHDAINSICEDNRGVAVLISATHNCVSCRGVKHEGASMQTTKISGVFAKEPSAKAEFLANINIANHK